MALLVQVVPNLLEPLPELLTEPAHSSISTVTWVRLQSGTVKGFSVKGFLRQLLQPLIAGRSYMMPAQFGPLPLERATGRYHEVTSLIVSYRTDRRKLAAYVPAPFRIAGEPTVIVLYAMNHQVDWLAGRSYNLIEVTTPVLFKGRVDRLQGYFALVLWENLCDPILTGREWQGMPKIFADIPDHTVTDQQWHASASHFEHKIVDLIASDLTELTPEQIEADAQATAGKDHWMGWRFFPAVGGHGTALSEPTVFPIERVTKKAWIGNGQLIWHSLTWEQNPTQCHIVNALAGLPILEYLPARATLGSSNLFVPFNPSRALR